MPRIDIAKLKDKPAPAPEAEPEAVEATVVETETVAEAPPVKKRVRRTKAQLALAKAEEQTAVVPAQTQAVAVPIDRNYAGIAGEFDNSDIDIPFVKLIQPNQEDIVKEHGVDIIGKFLYADDILLGDEIHAVPLLITKYYVEDTGNEDRLPKRIFNYDEMKDAVAAGIPYNPAAFVDLAIRIDDPEDSEFADMSEGDTDYLIARLSATGSKYRWAKAIFTQWNRASKRNPEAKVSDLSWNVTVGEFTSRGTTWRTLVTAVDDPTTDAFRKAARAAGAI